MPHSCSLTPFQSQVLQSIRRATEYAAGPIHGAIYPFTDRSISSAGRELFGSNWAGGWQGVSVLYIFFGQLQKMGLIERRDSPVSEGQGWGWWYLTPDGQALVGYPPLSV